MSSACFLNINRNSSCYQPRRAERNSYSAACDCWSDLAGRRTGVELRMDSDGSGLGGAVGFQSMAQYFIIYITEIKLQIWQAFMAKLINPAWHKMIRNAWQISSTRYGKYLQTCMDNIISLICQIPPVLHGKCRQTNVTNHVDLVNPAWHVSLVWHRYQQ